jgi:hypothetical protein
VRADALYRSLYADVEFRGNYTQVWESLHALGLDAPPLEKRQYRLMKQMRREGLL